MDFIIGFIINIYVKIIIINCCGYCIILNGDYLLGCCSVVIIIFSYLKVGNVIVIIGVFVGCNNIGIFVKGYCSVIVIICGF